MSTAAVNHEDFEQLSLELDHALEALGGAEEAIRVHCATVHEAIQRLHFEKLDVAAGIHEGGQSLEAVFAGVVNSSFEPSARPMIAKLAEWTDRLKSASQGMGADAGRLHANSTKITTDTGEFLGAVAGSYGPWSEAQEALRHEFTELTAATQKLAQEGTQTFHQFVETIRSEGRDTAHAIANVQNWANDQIYQSVPNFIRDRERDLHEAHAQFEGLAKDLAADVRSQLINALKSVEAHIGEKARSELQAEIDKLIDNCIGRLIEEGINALAQFGIGSAVTASLSEFLPELGVVYRASEAIKRTIKLLRELEHGFGLFH